MVKLFLMAMGIVCLMVSAQGQTDEAALERKYWNYRERMRLKYVKLNRLPGGGLSFAKIDRRIKCGEVQGAMQGGDLGMAMGYYLGALAMEYANLSRAGQNVNPTLNELYYAINAISRVDQNAEPFFNPDLDPSQNGFFLRQDFPLNFYQDWENQGDFIHMIGSGSAMGVVPKQGEALTLSVKTENGLAHTWYNYTSSFDDKEYEFPSQTYIDADGITAWKEVKCRYTDMGVDPITGAPTTREFKELLTNEMSQDQLIGYLFGLSFIQKFVPDLFLQPTALDRGFQLHTEIRQLVFAWMTFLSSQRVFGGNETHAFKIGDNKRGENGI